jgi:hypothetical protein
MHRDEFATGRPRGIRLDVPRDNHHNLAEWFPVIIAGHWGPNTLPREENTSDVEKFTQNRLDCILGGEFAPDDQIETDKIFYRLKEREAVPLHQVFIDLLPNRNSGLTSRRTLPDRKYARKTHCKPATKPVSSAPYGS